MKITPLSLLLATTFLSTSAMAQTTPTIDANYLNSLTGDKVTWEEVTASDEGAIEVAGKYYKATYHNIDNYEEIKDKTKDISVTSSITVYGVAINNPIDDNYGDVENKVFINNNVTGTIINNENSMKYLTVKGGVISNQGTIGNITADFIDNSIETIANGNYSNRVYDASEGGAIYNEHNIGNITGVFMNNQAYRGGAIYGDDGTIGDIIADFVNNKAENGAAITLILSTILLCDGISRFTPSINSK